MMSLNMKRVIAAVVFTTLLHGCAAHPSEPEGYTLRKFLAAKVLPYDSASQVIYRIDDHRFVTLENYRDCHHGQAYYNDTRAGIKANLGRAGIENYQGKLITADPTGNNLAFPSSGPPELPTRDRGLEVYLRYSTDGGRTFQRMVYMDHSLGPFEDSKDYAVFVTKNKLYVANRSADNDAYVVEYPLIPGVVLGKPYPPGVMGGSFALSKRLDFFSQLRTPSGQDRITCDPSIKPTNPDAPLVQ